MPINNLDLSKDYDFHGLLLDCLQIWGKKYNLTKDSTHRFAEILEKLIKSGIKFKSTYSVLSKDEAKKFNALDIPAKAFIEVKPEVSPNSSSPGSRNTSMNNDSVQRINS
jgi:hypothetical protein